MNNLLLKKTNELTKKKKKGFTLIELIIVIAIIAILAAIALPKFGQIRENGNVRADIATAKNIQTALNTAIANGELKAATATLDESAVKGYLDGGVVPKPKASGHTTETFNASIGSDGKVTVLVGTTQVLPSPSSPYNLS